MPDLDERLNDARADLLRQIKAPELSDIRHRARSIQRRRRGVAAAAAFACVIAVGTGVVLNGGGRADRVPPQPASTAEPAPVYRGGGLTLLGVSGGLLNKNLLDLPGLVQDVEFANAQRGYALSSDCDPGESPCHIGFATTTDAGMSWTQLGPPVEVMPRVPDLITVGDDGVLLRDGRSSWFSPDGLNWTTGESQGDPPPIGTPAEGSVLVLSGDDTTGDGCVARPVDAWQPGGLLRRLAKQPKLDVCWIGAAPAADGSWWVGGTTQGGGAPIVAVKRRGDADWGHYFLPAVPGVHGAWAEVSTVGSEAYVTVVSPAVADKYPLSRIVHAIYKLPFGSSEFQPYGDASSLGIIDGALVPLLDGRLTAASKETWLVSKADGTGFDLSRGPSSVVRIKRTGPYWAAYNLFLGGWVALSTDGETWTKTFVI